MHGSIHEEHQQQHKGQVLCFHSNWWQKLWNKYIEVEPSVLCFKKIEQICSACVGVHLGGGVRAQGGIKGRGKGTGVHLGGGVRAQGCI